MKRNFMIETQISYLFLIWTQNMSEQLESNNYVY